MFTGVFRPNWKTLVFAATLVLSGCGGGDQAKLRVMQASPNEGSVDVLVDGKSVANGVGYGTATNYLPVESGSREVQIVPTGSGTALIDQTLSFNSGAQSTIILANFASSITDLTLSDDNTAPTSGDAKLRVVNAAPSMGTVDVYVVAPGTNPMDATPTFSSLNFEGSSSYQTLTAGTYEVLFTLPGGIFAFIDTGPITLSDGQNRTIVALDNVSGGFSFTTLADLK